MKIFFSIFILTIAISANLSAQIEKTSSILEPSILECKYQCIQKLDTLGTISVTDTMILRIGKNISQFYAYSTFHLDSLASDPEGKEILRKQMFAAIKSLKPIPAPKITKEYLYKDYRTDTITTYIELQTPKVIVEKYEKQHWQLSDSTRNIFGHPCQLAVCKFRGRTYKAWYTTNIRCNEGPWKFNGLPGLITEIYDTQYHYHFTLIGISHEQLKPIYFYKTLKKSPEPINRIKYLKTKYEQYEKIRDRKKKRGQVIAYDFMEKDYHE